MDKLDNDLATVLDNISEAQSRWAFVVSSEYRVAIQTIAILSMASSILVILACTWVRLCHKKYFKRISLRISGFIAMGDLLSATAELLMMNTGLMLKQSASGLRFILWLSMFSSLLFVFLTLSISLQLHLSTLTKRVRVGVYMKMEKWYVPISFVLAAGLPAVAVSMMQDIFWVPWMHSFSWPVSAGKRRLVLWSCHFVWVALAILYTATISLLLAIVLRRMWRDSVQVIAEPRAPEKWDWARLTMSVRPSEDSSSSTLHSPLGRPSLSAKAGRGFMMTLMSNDALTGRAVAVRSYVDRRRFLRSVQRLVLYPLIPVITQLGIVACNMTEEPSKALYIYGTAMSATCGIFNLVVFALNPALPDIISDQMIRDSAI
ncbi:hypothetical protein LPJ78_004920 [Coemansia sp. RSA 989]|nr:hypothetical protein LPJ78_004920 [Coemansia sp. RSA 989]KAJ2622455.1 hypothetical protein H4R22_005175 [Coemansia sp. RSA 1290]KAJ2646291.1 hypothetical protein IWW40_005527 [Coemansia sp. RSA 1250]